MLLTLAYMLKLLLQQIKSTTTQTSNICAFLNMYINKKKMYVLANEIKNSNQN